MQYAEIDLLVDKLDSIKKLSSSIVQNIFMDIPSIKKLFNHKNCPLFTYEKSLFLLIPKHDKFYDILFCSSSEKELLKDTAIFLNDYTEVLDLRASIIGKETWVSSISDIFCNNNFVIGRKIARMRNGLPTDEMKNLISDFVKEKKYTIECAQSGDENEIFSLLKSEFDLRSDNIPEIDEIEENIKENQVLVVRKDGKIVSLYYFTTKNSTEYGWYDVTCRELRKENIYFYMMDYQIKSLAERKIPIRRYSWRDLSNKRLMNLAKKCNQTPDGIYIYNLLYEVKKLDGVK